MSIGIATSGFCEHSRNGLQFLLVVGKVIDGGLHGGSAVAELQQPCDGA